MAAVKAAILFINRFFLFGLQAESLLCFGSKLKT
jgi:hypothetical protein